MNNSNTLQPKLAIALLAAGEASRFGSPKQLANYKGQTLIERSIDLLASINCEFLVITGAHHDVIYDHLRLISKAQNVIYNPNWQQGMSSSIKTAVTHCPEHCAGMMFLTVDQIHIILQDIELLVGLWHKNRQHIVCAEYANHRGVPALFPKQSFSKLLTLEDDKGARYLIKSSPNVSTVVLPNAELDIDTVEQLEQQNNIATLC
jgi:molybdenum cofactor cytidylyltransferase